MYTQHALIRTMERTGLNNDAADKLIPKALERGKGLESFSANARKLLASKSRDGCRAIVYNGYCYIVNEKGICVTMYDISDRIKQNRHYDGKQRVRDVMKYRRMNSDYLKREEYGYGTRKAS